MIMGPLQLKNEALNILAFGLIFQLLNIVPLKYKLLMQKYKLKMLKQCINDSDQRVLAESYKLTSSYPQMLKLAEKQM